jgi:stearoyl-CoA desaturase (delta-9 desaturase)
MSTPPAFARIARLPDERVQSGAISFFLIHAVALAGAIYVGFSWKLLGFAVLFYYLRMAGTTIGYHRYFSHRTFKTSRAFQLVLAFWAETSAQKGALWWASHHRDHHKFSDTAGDVHSPLRGFWWSHMGWILCKKYNDPQHDKIKDFAKFPELRWLDKHYLVPPTLLAIAMALVGGLPALVWGFFVSTVLLWHGTFLVNSLNHVWGSVRYESKDLSKNNALIALLTMGEGWHNNHHHYQSSANQGFFWWEYDFSYYLIRLFESVGLVRDVRTPPKHILADTIAARAHAAAPEPLAELAFAVEHPARGVAQLEA